MSDYRLGPKVVKKAEPVPDKLVPVNRSGTVVMGKDGRLQTRTPLPGPRYPTPPPVVDPEPE